jgi:glutathione S-transferase/maleylpyruvate isomerase
LNDLIVYAIPPSLYCAKLRIVLRHKGLQWDERPPPGGYGSSEYKKLVPSGNLPALVHGDLVLGDSEAIAEYLNDEYPEPAMLPPQPVERARVRERSRFHDTRLEPALRQLFKYIPRASRDGADVKELGDAVNTRLAQLGELIDHAPPQNDSLTLGDCGFAITFEWLHALSGELIQMQWPERVKQWHAQITAHDAVASELADYRPNLNAYLNATL